ncbi:MAG TPA: HlyD family secretion protein [Geomonas sp.]|nr:HlyD family secretion protein [Geomonas sp.]
MKYRTILRFTCTIAVLAAAVLAGRALWNRYMNSPWTRDGRVRADVIKVASDVSGIVVGVPVRDNQQVRKGELLFTIDRERYRLALAKAEASLAARKAELNMKEQEAGRRRELENIAVSAELVQNSQSQVESAAAACDEARVAVQTAKLNLQRTEVRSPVDGYVTNLNVHPGDFASAGEAKLALIDKNSFAVYGYFEETKLQLLQKGDPVDIRLLGGEQALKGHIESLARGISDRDNPTSRELLSDVNPVMNWVRLAQRVPVRIRLDEVPRGLQLSSGMTCTIVVRPQPLKQLHAAARL